MEINLNTTAAQWDFTFLLGDTNDFPIRCHMAGAVVPSSMFEGIFRTIDLSSRFLFEIVVKRLIHASEKSDASAAALDSDTRLQNPVTQVRTHEDSRYTAAVMRP